MSQIDGETMVLDSFPRGKWGSEKLVVALSEFRGHRYVDVRVHRATPDGWRATSKGATIKLHELEGVILALQRANQILRGGPDPVDQAGRTLGAE